MEQQEQHTIATQLFIPGSSLTVLSCGRHVSISIASIMQISKYGYETVIYTTTESYRTVHSLQDLLQDLPEDEFHRVHRSHIIALKHIRGVKKKKVIMGEFFVPVSVYYYRILMSYLQERINKEYHFIELKLQGIPL